MKYIKNTINNEIIINKSRFITSIYRINNSQEADEILNDVRKKHISANHNCFAYIIGENQEIQKCSDDGEPAKTAGYPMLEVLKKNNLTNILAITTRYFGGVMLGSGGLIRAYSQSVSTILKDATFFRKKTLSIYDVVIDYSLYNILLNSNIEYQTIDTKFTDNVILTIGIAKENYESVIKSITDLTNASALIKYISDKIIEINI